MKHRGFTLAEVLIALTLIGVIATFTVPKVLQSTANVEKHAVLKETIAVLQDQLYQGVLTGELYQAVTFYNYLSTHLNTVQTCDNDFNTMGCYTGTTPLNNLNKGGLVLPSGATVVDIGIIDISSCRMASSVNLCGDAILVDYNGSKLPNVTGKDRLWITVNLNPTAEDIVGDGVIRGPGTAFVPISLATSYTLYQELLQ